MEEIISRFQALVSWKAVILSVALGRSRFLPRFYLIHRSPACLLHTMLVLSCSVLVFKEHLTLSQDHSSTPHVL